jgi:hypothetical protein
VVAVVTYATFSLLAYGRDVLVISTAGSRSPPHSHRDASFYPAEDQGYHYHPFDAMFFPLEPKDSPNRSVVFFTSGADGIPNVDLLVNQWGSTKHDYVILVFDKSMAEWEKLPWYDSAVFVHVHRQAKFWWFKRFVQPWMVRGYRYIHFVDSDAGNPPGQQFDLGAYEEVLAERDVKLAQPALLDGPHTSVWAVPRQKTDLLMRWTNFIEVMRIMMMMVVVVTITVVMMMMI